MIQVRTSERTTFARCEFRWWLAYCLRLRPREVAVPLKFGDLIHRALAEYYKPEARRLPGKKSQRGPHPAVTFNEIYDELEASGQAFKMKANVDEDDPKWGDARSLGTHMLENYIERWGDDRQFRVISPEMPFQVKVRGVNGKVFMYVGTLDGLVEDLNTGKLLFFEHKTAATISTEHLMMDEQAGSYWAFGPEFLRTRGFLGQRESIDGVLYNFLRKGFKDDRPTDDEGRALNKDGTVSKRQPAPLFKRQMIYRSSLDAEQLVERVRQQEEQMRQIREGERKPIKSILQGCTGMFGCPFRDVCEIHETGGDFEFVVDTLLEEWDPYEIHGKGEDD